MQSRDTKNEFPTLIAFNQNSIFIITEILHGKVKCEPEDTTNNTESFWADVHLRDLGDYKYEYILYQNEEYRLHPVTNLNNFKKLVQNKNELTKESVIQNAINLKRWCLLHDITKAPDGTLMMVCSECPFVTKDEDGDGDCMVGYPLDWKEIKI